MESDFDRKYSFVSSDPSVLYVLKDTFQRHRAPCFTFFSSFPYFQVSLANANGRTPSNSFFFEPFRLFF